MFQPSNKLKTNCASVDSGHRKMLSKSAPGSRAELGSVGFGLEFPNFHGEIMENSWNIVVYHGICIPNPIIPITISAWTCVCSTTQSSKFWNSSGDEAGFSRPGPKFHCNQVHPAAAQRPIFTTSWEHALQTVLDASKIPAVSQARPII